MTSSFWKNRKVLVSITSFRVDPFEFLRQANELKIEESALFLTGIKDLEVRKKLYSELEKSSIKSVPCVHLITENEPWELDYLIKTFKTKAFNVHVQKEYPSKHDLSAYKQMIYVENTHFPLDEDEIKKYAGVCIDVCHLEESKHWKSALYEKNFSIVKKFKVGFNHISPFGSREEEDLEKAHLMFNLNQFDYLKYYPEKIFGPYLAIEARNNIYEQVKIKKYIENLL